MEPDPPGFLTRDRVTGPIDAFLNTSPVFTRDGKHVVFVSTRDGLPQPYVATITGSETRIATTTQRIRDVFAAPGGKDILFSSDKDADEHWSFFRVGLDGKNLIELTPSTKLNRDEPVVPDGRPSQLYFTARKMSEAASTLYVTSATAAAEPKALYTDPIITHLMAVSADGKTGLLRRYISRSENQVLRVDLDTGAVAQIFPAAGAKVSVFEAGFSRDGKRALIATDNGEEAALLLSLDIATGKQLAKRAFTPATAQLTGLAIAKEGGLAAVTLSAGTRSEIHVIDARSLVERTTVGMPPGSGGATEFSDDGKQLLATWSTPDRPTDLFIVDPRGGKITPRNEARPTLKNLAIDASTVDVPAFDGGKLPTNVLVAMGEKGTKHPVVVVFHGGPAGVSPIRWNPLTAVLLANGYVVVEPNIRGSTGFGRAFEAADNYKQRDASFKDVETIGRWVAQQPWADKDRVVAAGGSWGGYLTLIALTRTPDLWRAGVDLFGVVNLRSTIATTSGVNRQVSLVEIGDPDKDGEFLDSISPGPMLGKVVDPLFVYAGQNDPRVPRPESDFVVRALRGRKIPVEYMVAANEGHSVARRVTQIELYARVLRFLELHLK